MNVQGAFNQLFRAGFRKNFLDELMEFEQEYDQFLKTSTMDGPEIMATIMVGMPRLFEIGDGDPVPYDDPKMGSPVVGVDKTFCLGFGLTRKTVQDDKYGKANQSAKWLGHAVNMTKEFRSSAFLDDAFTGTTFKGIDGLKLCSTAHTLINSSTTVPNTPTVPVGLSVAGVTALSNLAGQCKDQNGDPMKVMLDTILIGNDATNIQKCMQIFGSDLEPFTADNQDNAIKKRYPKIKTVVSHYMASSVNYFMIDSRLNDAHFVTRMAPLFEDSFDFNTKVALYSVTMRFLVWFVAWWGWYGANPS